MKKFILTIVLATLCLFFRANAQSQTLDIKPLNIGDRIPEAFWKMPLQVVNHAGGTKTITLNDYRNKLIILDFWATYCAPCIKSLELLDTIKQSNLNNLEVIPVLAYDLPANALPFMIEREWKFYSVVNDTLLNKVLFPRVLTGFGSIWVYKGKLLAAPIDKYLSYDTIARILSGRKVNFENRNNKTGK